MCSPEPRPRLLALEGGHCAAKWKMTEHGFGAASLGRSWRSRPRGTEMDVVGPGTLWEGAESAGGREGGRRPLTAGGRAGTVRPASRSRARGPHLPYLRLSTAAEGQTQAPQFQAAAAATSFLARKRGGRGCLNLKARGYYVILGLAQWWPARTASGLSRPTRRRWPRPPGC